MGNCAGPAGPSQGACNGWSQCQFKVYDSPTLPEEYKINALLNFFCGFQSSQDIINFVNNSYNSGNGYNAVYPLIFPPALQYIACVNEDVHNDGSSRVLNSNEYTMVLNPYWNQAQIIENLMFGQSAVGAFPCTPNYYVPFSYSGELVINFVTIPNKAYTQCMNSMTKQLIAPQPIGNSLECVDGINVFLPGLSYSSDLIQQQINTLSTLVTKCVSDASQCSQVLFNPTKVGPYDTSNNQVCQDLSSPNCTYEKCKNTQPTGGWNCTSGGRCIQVSAGGTFSSLEDCQGCQANGTCPGNSVCCPEAQAPTYGTCGCGSGTGPLPIPGNNMMKDALIGLSIMMAVMGMIILGIRILRKQ